MGSSLACVYATIYYSYHEETVLLPKYSNRKMGNSLQIQTIAPASPLPSLLLHARLIDDAIQIWDTDRLPPNALYSFTKKLESEMKFGILEWEANAPTREVNFLDLTVRIGPDGKITCSTFVKPQNLFLYIPLKSAHPKGVLKSLVFGRLQSYAIQNCKRSDFISITKSLFLNLLKRGYTADILTPLFREAAMKIEAMKTGATSTATAYECTQQTISDRIFIHWEYHPKGVDRATIRDVFNDTLTPALTAEGISSKKLTIAFSTPRSLGQNLTKTQLKENPSNRVSLYIEQLESPSQPLTVNTATLAKERVEAGGGSPYGTALHPQNHPLFDSN